MASLPLLYVVRLFSRSLDLSALVASKRALRRWLSMVSIAHNKRLAIKRNELLLNAILSVLDKALGWAQSNRENQHD